MPYDMFPLWEDKVRTDVKESQMSIDVFNNMSPKSSKVPFLRRKL